MINKATFADLGLWAAKCLIAAVILVVSIQAYKRLDRHTLLVDAILNDFRQAAVARQMQQKAIQELPGPDDPVPTGPEKK